MAQTSVSGPFRSENGFRQGTAGDYSQSVQCKTATLTIAGAGNYDATVTIPVGSTIITMKAITGTAISGSPTTVNLTVGDAAGDAEYVAAVDVKAQGIFTLTQVTSAAALFSSTTTDLYVRAAVSGGTDPAGTVKFIVEYMPPTS